MTTIQVRTEDQLKKHAQRVLEELGLDLSSAINMYLHQIVLTESIPFPIRTANGFSPTQEQAMLQETAESLKNGTRYPSADAVLRDILGSSPPKAKNLRNRRSKSSKRSRSARM